jgi:hypothetical protein
MGTDSITTLQGAEAKLLNRYCFIDADKEKGGK